jgi:hypothetical protein
VNPENIEANIPDDGILTPATEAIVPSKLRVLRQNGFWLYGKSPMHSLRIDRSRQVGLSKVPSGDEELNAACAA